MAHIHSSPKPPLTSPVSSRDQLDVPHSPAWTRWLLPLSCPSSSVRPWRPRSRRCRSRTGRIWRAGWAVSGHGTARGEYKPCVPSHAGLRDRHMRRTYDMQWNAQIITRLPAPPPRQSEDVQQPGRPVLPRLRGLLPPQGPGLWRGEGARLAPYIGICVAMRGKNFGGV